MMWHKKYRQTIEPHAMTWFEIEEEHMMDSYIQCHHDEQVMEILEGPKRDAEYSCSDPRLHIRVRQDANRFTNTATERHQEDFESLFDLSEDYIQHNKSLFCDSSVASHEILGSWSS